MKARFVLPGCSLLLWALFAVIGISLQTFSSEQTFHYRWLPALMALGSLALIFLARVKYVDVAAQILAIILLLFFGAFFLSYTGGI